MNVRFRFFEREDRGSAGPSRAGYIDVSGGKWRRPRLSRGSYSRRLQSRHLVREQYPLLIDRPGGAAAVSEISNISVASRRAHWAAQSLRAPGPHLPVVKAARTANGPQHRSRLDFARNCFVRRRSRPDPRETARRSKTQQYGIITQLFVKGEALLQIILGCQIVS